MEDTRVQTPSTSMNSFRLSFFPTIYISYYSNRPYIININVCVTWKNRIRHRTFSWPPYRYLLTTSYFSWGFYEWLQTFTIKGKIILKSLLFLNKFWILVEISMILYNDRLFYQSFPKIFKFGTIRYGLLRTKLMSE